MDEGYDVVSGWRKERSEALITRRLPSMLANRLISQITRTRLHDHGCTLKAYHADVVAASPLRRAAPLRPALAGLVGAPHRRDPRHPPAAHPRHLEVRVRPQPARRPRPAHGALPCSVTSPGRCSSSGCSGWFSLLVGGTTLSALVAYKLVTGRASPSVRCWC